jgi:hypothetical protein
VDTQLRNGKCSIRAAIGCAEFYIFLSELGKVSIYYLPHVSGMLVSTTVVRFVEEVHVGSCDLSRAS